MAKHLLILLSIVLFLSEIMLQADVIIGFLSYALLIGGCLIALAKADSLDETGKMIIVFMILPVIRIAGLFIELDYFWKAAVVYYLLCFLVIYYLIKFKINLEIDWKRWPLFFLGILAMTMLGLLAKIFLDIETIPGMLILLPVIAFSEEILFRGMIQNLIGKTSGAFASMFFTSLLYAIFNISYGLPAAVFMFFASMIICLFYYASKNIIFSMAFSFVLQLLVFAL